MLNAEYQMILTTLLKHLPNQSIFKLQELAFISNYSLLELFKISNQTSNNILSLPISSLEILTYSIINKEYFSHQYAQWLVNLLYSQPWYIAQLIRDYNLTQEYNKFIQLLEEDEYRLNLFTSSKLIKFAKAQIAKQQDYLTDYFSNLLTFELSQSLIEKAKQQFSSFASLKVCNSYSSNTDIEFLQLPFLFAIIEQKIYPLRITLTSEQIIYFTKENITVQNYFNLGKQIIFINFYALDSTSLTAEKWLQANFLSEKTNIVLNCNFQFGGIGRRNRTWFSNPFADITCTIISNTKQIQSNLISSLALETANIIHRSIGNEQLIPSSKQLTIKWPNDIYLESAKIVGILITNYKQHIINGFGINVLAKNINQEQIIARATESLLSKQVSEFTDICQIYQICLNLILNITKEYIKRTTTVERFNFAYFTQNNYFNINEKVIITPHQDGSQSYVAIYKGVNYRGELLIAKEDQTTESFLVPNITIRKYQW